MIERKKLSTIKQQNIQANDDKDSYNRALERLNAICPGYKDSYHLLASMLAQFIITLFDVRRGQEGISSLTINHYECAEEDGQRFWRKVMAFGMNFSKVISSYENKFPIIFLGFG